jgi:hypothetical protein
MMNNLAAGALWLAVLLGGQLGVGYSLIQENDHLARLRTFDAEECRRHAPADFVDDRATCFAVPHERLEQWLKDKRRGIDAYCHTLRDGYEKCMRESYPLEWSEVPRM